jgi:hypothetical protein
MQTHTYEIRLLDRDGGTTLVYFLQCANEGDARDRVNRLQDVSYDRYELWDGLLKIGEGPRLTVVV